MSFSVFGIPIGKDKKREVLSGWKITTDLDITEGFSMEILEKQMERLMDNEIEFVIVEPPDPVENCNFLQFCPDSDGKNGAIHLEASLRRKSGGSTLWGKDDLTGEQVLEIIRDFAYDEKAPNVTDWESIGVFE